MNFAQRALGGSYASPFFQQRSPSPPIPLASNTRVMHPRSLSSSTGRSNKQVVTVEWQERPPTPASRRREVPCPPLPLPAKLRTKQATSINGWQSYLSFTQFGVQPGQQLIYPQESGLSSSSSREDSESFRASVAPTAAATAAAGNRGRSRRSRQQRYELAVLREEDGQPFRLLMNPNDQSTLVNLRHATKRGKRVLFPELQHHDSKGAVTAEQGRKAFSVSPRKRVSAPDIIATPQPTVPTPLVTSKAPVTAPGLAVLAAGKAARPLPPGRSLSSQNMGFHRSMTDAGILENAAPAPLTGQSPEERGVLSPHVEEEEVSNEPNEEESRHQQHHALPSAGFTGDGAVVSGAATADAKPSLSLHLPLQALGTGGSAIASGSGDAASGLGTVSSTGRARGTTAASFDDPSLVSELLLGPGGVSNSLSARSRSGSTASGGAGAGYPLGLGGQPGRTNGQLSTSSDRRSPGKVVSGASAKSPRLASSSEAGALSPLSHHARASTITGPVRHHQRGISGISNGAPSTSIPLGKTSTNIAAASAALDLALQASTAQQPGPGQLPQHQHSLSLGATGERLSPQRLTSRSRAAGASGSSMSPSGPGAGKLTGALRGLGAGIVSSLGAGSAANKSARREEQAHPHAGDQPPAPPIKPSESTSLSPSKRQPHYQSQQQQQQAPNARSPVSPPTSKPFYERIISTFSLGALRNTLTGMTGGGAAATTATAAGSDTAASASIRARGGSPPRK